MTVLNLKKSSGDNSKFKPTEDTHVGVCYGVWYVGTQVQEYKGEEKRKMQFVVSWEIDELIVDPEGEYDQKRKVVSKRYTASAHEKATLMIDLKSWLGRELTDEEIENFDLKKLILGKSAQLQIVHNGDYANVNSVSKLHKSMTPLEPELSDEAPKWVEDLKEKSLERQAELKAATEDDLPF